MPLNKHLCSTDVLAVQVQQVSKEVIARDTVAKNKVMRLDGRE